MMEPSNCSSCGAEIETAIIEKPYSITELYVCLECGEIIEVQGDSKQ